MARHDQRPSRSLMTCQKCKAGNCAECVDVLRMVYTDDPICQCRRKNHAGEPRDSQVADPETGTVFTPGLSVTQDGEVNYDWPAVE